MPRGLKQPMLEPHRARSRHAALLTTSPHGQDSDAWMMSYIDIMTLLVALFVFLLTMSGQASGLGELFLQDSRPRLVTPAAQSAAVSVSRGMGAGSKPVVHEMAIAAAVGVAEAEFVTPQARAAAIQVAPRAVISEKALAAARQVSHRRVIVNAQALAAAREVAENRIRQPDVQTSQQEVEALPSIEGVEVSRIEEGINLRIQDHLLFDSADATLTASGREVVQKLVAMLEQVTGDISVEGHSDSRPISTPRFPSNWELSSMRASAILRYLKDAGIEASRLRAIGYAETRPIADNDTAQGRAANRRVEVIIHKTR